MSSVEIIQTKEVLVFPDRPPTSAKETAMYVVQDISASMYCFKDILMKFFPKFHTEMEKSINLKRVIQFDDEMHCYTDIMPYYVHGGGTSITAGLKGLHDMIHNDIKHQQLTTDMNILILFITDGDDNRFGSLSQYKEIIGSINKLLFDYSNVASTFVGVGFHFPTQDFLLFNQMLGKEISNDTMFLLNENSQPDEIDMFISDCISQIGIGTSAGTIPPEIQEKLLFKLQKPTDEVLFVAKESESAETHSVEEWRQIALTLGRVAYRYKDHRKDITDTDKKWLAQLKTNIQLGLRAEKNIQKETMMRLPGRIARYGQFKQASTTTEDSVIQSNLKLVQYMIDDTDLKAIDDCVLHEALSLNNRQFQSQKQEKQYHTSLKLRGVDKKDICKMEQELETIASLADPDATQFTEEDRCFITLEGIQSSLIPSNIKDALSQSDHTSLFILSVLGVVGRPIYIKSKSSVVALAPYSFDVDSIVTGNCTSLSSTEMAAMRTNQDDDNDCIVVPLGEGNQVYLTSVIPLFSAGSEISPHMLALLPSRVWSYWCTYALYSEPSMIVPEAHLAGCIGIFLKLITKPSRLEHEERLLKDVLFTGNLILDHSRHPRIKTLKELWVKECPSLLRSFQKSAPESEAEPDSFAFLHELLFVWKVMLETESHSPSNEFVDAIFQTWTSWIVKMHEKYNDGKSIFELTKVLHFHGMDEKCMKYISHLLDPSNGTELVSKGVCWKAAQMKIQTEVNEICKTFNDFEIKEDPDFNLFDIQKLGICGPVSIHQAMTYFDVDRSSEWKQQLYAHGLCVLGPRFDTIHNYCDHVPCDVIHKIKINSINRLFDANQIFQKLEEQYKSSFDQFHDTYPKFEKNGKWPSNYCVNPKCPFYMIEKFDKFGFAEHLQQITHRTEFVFGAHKTILQECQKRKIDAKDWYKLDSEKKQKTIQEIRQSILDGDYLFPDKNGNKIDNYRPEVISIEEVQMIINSYIDSFEQMYEI